MAGTEQLNALLSHECEPRGSLFLEFGTEYGTLRLDCAGDDPQGLLRAADAPVPAETRQAVERALADPDPWVRIDVLREAVSRHPVVAGLHRSLSLAFRRAGDADEALYHARQAVAVDQSFGPLAMLATSLGMAGRIDDALVVFAHLWERRHQADPVERAGATQDYLHTLLLAERWPLLAGVAGQAWAEDPADANAAAQLATAHHRMGRPGDVEAQVAELLAGSKPAMARTVAERVLIGAAGADWRSGRDLTDLFVAHGCHAAALAVLDRVFDLPGLPDAALPALLHLRERVDAELDDEGRPAWGVQARPGQAETLTGWRLALHRAVAHDVPGPGGLAVGPDDSFGRLAAHLAAPDPDVVLDQPLSPAHLSRYGTELAGIRRCRETDPHDARAHARDLVRRYPLVAQGYALLAETCADLGDHDDAVYQARQAMALRPCYSYLYLLGVFLRAAGRTRDALLVLNHVWVHRERASTLREARHGRMNYYMALNTKPGMPVMLSAARDAAAEDPEDDVTAYYLALAQLNAGELVAAKITLDELTRRTGPGHPLWGAVCDLTPLIDRTATAAARR